MSDEPGHLLQESQTSTSTTELVVSGMTCNNCARHVTEAVQSVPGVQSASVALEAGRATVRWTAGKLADIPAVLGSIHEAGYEAREATEMPPDHGGLGWQLNLWIGVLVTVPLMVGEWAFGLAMVPWFQWVSFGLAAVVQVFAGGQFYRGAWRQLKAGHSNMDTLVALGSTTAFGFSMWVLLGGHGGHVYFMEAAAIITLISLGHWVEARVSSRASSALKALLNLAPQTARQLQRPMTANPGEYSGLPTFSPHPNPLPQGEGTAKGGAGGFIKSGYVRRPEVVGPSEKEVEVPVAVLRAGDWVVLRPGDHVPVDGVVMDGASAVDEAMLTGESVPMDKAAGSTLYAGTVNMNGRLVMRVTATGAATALAHIIAAVERAQTSRANIQRLGDRVSNVFVPVVVSIAAVTLLWWAFLPERAYAVFDSLSRFFWLAHVPSEPVAAAFVCAAAVLIVACPCAMGLATPAAIMAAANAAARRGILIRDGVALEKAGEVTSIVFDKTGTLTAGKPEVVKIWEGAKDTDISTIAAALARNSTHPISQAVAKISTANVMVENWREVRGGGVGGKLKVEDGGWKMARLGSLKWLIESGVDLAAGEGFVNEWSEHGATVVGLAVDGALGGLFAIKDILKPGAAEVVRQLHQQGLKVYLLTGDNARTAASIAKQVGIPSERVFAEVRPEQKAELVKKLQGQGERVAFVGDGINDAPALEQADLGVAVSRASDVARAAADVILLKSEIEAVPEVLGLARATLRTIKQNLFWAFFYNAVGVPLAALGFMSPILCAAAMGFSDLIVIGNALRLSRWRGR